MKKKDILEFVIGAIIGLLLGSFFAWCTSSLWLEQGFV